MQRTQLECHIQHDRQKAWKNLCSWALQSAMHPSKLQSQRENKRMWKQRVGGGKKEKPYGWKSVRNMMAALFEGDPTMVKLGLYVGGKQSSEGNTWHFKQHPGQAVHVCTVRPWAAGTQFLWTYQHCYRQARRAEQKKTVLANQCGFSCSRAGLIDLGLLCLLSLGQSLVTSENDQQINTFGINSQEYFINSYGRELQNKHILYLVTSAYSFLSRRMPEEIVKCLQAMFCSNKQVTQHYIP